jgi:hypothetical protein
MEENQQTAWIVVQAKRAWPFIQRIINITVYGSLNFLKTIVQYMINQIKNI